MGTAYSFGRLGMIVGPFIAQTVFQKTFFVGVMINVGSLMLLLVATVCLPYRSKSQMLE